jgi:septum formation protein
LLLPNFEIDPADIDEAVRADESPSCYVARIAVEKASAVAARHRDCLILASDTAVVVDGRILGKPRDDREASAMLGSLSGRGHDVLSAVVLRSSDQGSQIRVSATRVEFAELPRSWIDAYARSGEPLDKAGAYAIQGGAAAWIRRIEGSYSGVVGLPLFETAALLRQAGLDGQLFHEDPFRTALRGGPGTPAVDQSNSKPQDPQP